MTFNALSTKNTLLEADLTTAKEQFDDQQNEIKRMEIEREQAVHRIRRECKQEKDELIDVQEKLQRDLNESNEAQRRLNEKNHDLERKNEALLSDIRDLRETVSETFGGSVVLMSFVDHDQ